MVAAGWGLTLLPKLATTGPFASGQGVTIKTLPKPTPHRVLGAVWRKSSARLKAIDAVCSVISDVMTE
jgi:LysR family hydrogen peroxide-inducible transcriptional activator